MNQHAGGTRSLVARVLGVVACGILPFAMSSAWLAAVVSDTDRFVATVAPLAEDPAVQASAEAQLEAVINDALSIDTDSALGSTLADALHRAVVNVVEGDAFPPAWEAAVTSAHTQLIAVLEGDSAVVDADGQVTLRMATLVNTVLGMLDDRGLLPPTAPTSVDVGFPVMDAGDLEQARAAYQALDAAGLWLPLLWLVLVGATVLLAVRRGRAVAWLAAGSAASLVLLLAAVRLGELAAVDSLAPSDRPLAEAVLDVVLHGLRTGIFVALLVSAVVLLGGWLVAGARHRLAGQDFEATGTTGTPATGESR